MSYDSDEMARNNSNARSFNVFRNVSHPGPSQPSRKDNEARDARGRGTNIATFVL